ncbi:hypothetical protein [Shewanella sp. TB4-MNA-CIBAN-0142]|uniref:hypothetical protein n=1 Tax=Shewanella sp. TB4-MNA-CIBAN-0142 TaxID=3140464 RepID=UPI00332B4432
MSEDIAKGIHSATSVVNSIPEFMKALTDVMETPYGWIILAVILIWFLLNKDLSRFLNIFETKEKKRLDKLEVYVNNKEAANNEALEVIKDLRDAHYFKVATDIYAEKSLRDSLINLHKKTSHTINWINIKRAMPYINADSTSTVSIRDQSRSEKFGYFYNLFTGWLFLGFAVALSLVFIFSNDRVLSQFALWIASTLFCAFFAMFAFSQNFPIRAAKKIKTELEKVSTTNVPATTEAAPPEPDV